MKRFVVIVLDGFGIGAMDDVATLRPQDSGANTALHIFQALPELALPALTSLGLGNAILAANTTLETSPSSLPPALRAAKFCCYGVHRLAHIGADTFWGHQELMGTKPKKGESGPLLSKLPLIREALEKEGRKVRFYTGEGKNGQAMNVPGILIVDEGVTIGDNLETDLGDNYNVTAALDLVPFEAVKKIGRLVRSMVRSSRVIVFGGQGVGLINLLEAFESRKGYAGVNAPRSGVYRKGYQVVHLGFGVNAETQLPKVLNSVKIPAVLIGKVADIVENPGASGNSGASVSGVDTEEVLSETRRVLDSLERGFICTNVQETDLAGHRQDPQLYGEKLVLADRGIMGIMEKLTADDIMVVTADHGNDPAIGHPQHTREKTPILVLANGMAPNKQKAPVFLGERASLADTGATAADFFGAPNPETGSSYLKFLKSQSMIR